MLSATAEYALRAVLILARADASQPLRAEAIAAATGAPRNYLSKTLHALAKAGIVRSARGPLGGFTLAVPAESLTIAAIADAFSEPPRTRACLLGSGPCNASAPCSAHAKWSGLMRASQDAMARTSIADLLDLSPL